MVEETEKWRNHLNIPSPSPYIQISDTLFEPIWPYNWAFGAKCLTPMYVLSWMWLFMCFHIHFSFTIWQYLFLYPFGTDNIWHAPKSTFVKICVRSLLKWLITYQIDLQCLLPVRLSHDSSSVNDNVNVAKGIFDGWNDPCQQKIKQSKIHWNKCEIPANSLFSQ